LYFDRADVKAAIHAPANVDWTECSNVNVFPRGDASPPSALSVLPNVIEKSVRTVIVHGLADFILIAEGFVSNSVLIFSLANRIFILYSARIVIQK
jgi:carboxypeptidase D